MKGWIVGIALGAYRRVVRRSPVNFRLRYEDEMVAALAALLAAFLLFCLMSDYVMT